MAEGERIAEKEMEGDKSVAQLLSEGKPSKKKEKKEERDGEKVIKEEKEDPEVKTV
jgi:hypothetical protein